MIHSSAIIDSSAVIEENVSIGAFSVIGRGVIIKSGSVIGSRVHIECSEIGKNCIVGSFSSIGGSPQDLGYNNEPSKVYVGNDTLIGEFVTLNRGTKKTLKTMIGKKCVISDHAHVAHDSVISDDVFIGAFCQLAGHVEIGEGTHLCDLAGVHQFTKIGKYVILTKECIATMDVIPFVIAYGKRAVISGVNEDKKISSQRLLQIKKAYKTLFKSKLLLKDALEIIEQDPSQDVKDIVSFIKSSKRGLIRPA